MGQYGRPPLATAGLLLTARCTAKHSLAITCRLFVCPTVTLVIRPQVENLGN